jgi:hypothetical protein
VRKELIAFGAPPFGRSLTPCPSPCGARGAERQDGATDGEQAAGTRADLRNVLRGRKEAEKRKAPPPSIRGSARQARREMDGSGALLRLTARGRAILPRAVPPWSGGGPPAEALWISVERAPGRHGVRRHRAKETHYANGVIGREYRINVLDCQGGGAEWERYRQAEGDRNGREDSACERRHGRARRSGRRLRGAVTPEAAPARAGADALVPIHGRS